MLLSAPLAIERGGGAQQEHLEGKKSAQNQSFLPLERPFYGPKLLANCVRLDGPVASGLELPWGFSQVLYESFEAQTSAFYPL